MIRFLEILRGITLITVAVVILAIYIAITVNYLQEIRVIVNG